MTRAEIKAGAGSRVLLALTAADDMALIGRVFGPDGNFGNPIVLEDELDQQVLELCRACRGVYATFTTDLEDGGTQDIPGEYCPPDLLWYESVTATYDTGLAAPLEILRSDQLRAKFPQQATDPQTGDPTVVAILSPRLAQIYPIPDYAVTSGLKWRGIGFVDRSLWAAQSDELSAIVERMHTAIAYGLTARLLDAINRPNLSESYWRGYKYNKGHFEGELSTLFDNMRQRTDAYPASYITGNNPLNL